MTEKKHRCDEHNWMEHRLHVLMELQRLNQEMKSINQQLIMIHTSVASLKSDIKHKGGLYGLIAGCLPVIGLALWEVLK